MSILDIFKKKEEPIEIPLPKNGWSIVKFKDGCFGIRRVSYVKADSTVTYEFLDATGVTTWISLDNINRYCKFKSLKQVIRAFNEMSTYDPTNDYGEPI